MNWKLIKEISTIVIVWLIAFLIGVLVCFKFEVIFNF